MALLLGWMFRRVHALAKSVMSYFGHDFLIQNKYCKNRFTYILCAVDSVVDCMFFFFDLLWRAVHNMLVKKSLSEKPT